jgi:hypothetical protein
MLRRINSLWGRAFVPFTPHEFKTEIRPLGAEFGMPQVLFDEEPELAERLSAHWEVLNDPQKLSSYGRLSATPKDVALFYARESDVSEAEFVARIEATHAYREAYERLLPLLWKRAASATTPKLLIDPTAYARMIGLMRLSPVEVSWFGFLTVVAPDVYLLDEVLVAEQHCSSGRTENPEEAMYHMGIEIRRTRPQDRNRLRFWGHSHVYMPPFPSMQDDKQAAIWCRGLRRSQQYRMFIRVIGNKNGTMKVDVYDLEQDLAFFDVPWELSTDAELEREFREKVHISPFLLGQEDAEPLAEAVETQTEPAAATAPAEVQTEVLPEEDSGWEIALPVEEPQLPAEIVPAQKPVIRVLVKRHPYTHRHGARLSAHIRHTEG